MRPRDNQRQRVYDAERVLETSTTLSWQETQEWVATITKSAWWKNRGGGPVEVRDGRGRRAACAGRGYIKMPKRARQRVLILHELAHTITPRSAASHGPEYAGNFLALVRRWMGEADAETLKASFKRGRVKARGANRVRRTYVKKYHCLVCRRETTKAWSLGGYAFCTKAHGLEWANKSIKQIG